MFCPQCGARNPEGSRFCSSCANQLPTGSGDAPSQGQGPQGTMIMPPSAPNRPPASAPPYSPPQEQNYGGNPYTPPSPADYQQQYPQPQQYQQYPPYQQQQLPYSPAGKANSKATTAMVLSILSIVPGFCISFIPFFGLVAPALGIAGAVIGKNELDAIKQGRSPRAGESTAKAGFIIGIIGGILNLFGVLGACARVIN